jgi:hypothetical protein
LKTTRAILTGARREVVRQLCSTTFRKICWWLLTNRILPFPRLTACTAATIRARAPWSSMVSGCLRALDNRPLRFEEFESMLKQAILVSATPGPWELEHSAAVVEQIIRPTGLVDPEIEVRPAQGQVDDLYGEIRSGLKKISGCWLRR